MKKQRQKFLCANMNALNQDSGLTSRIFSPKKKKKKKYKTKFIYLLIRDFFINNIKASLNLFTPTIVLKKIDSQKKNSLKYTKMINL